VKETLIRAQVQGTDAEVFIYNDEAGLHGPEVDKRFEAPDYSDGGTLARAFVQETVDYAKRYGTANITLERTAGVHSLAAAAQRER
jgi:hypothetical protein